MRLRCPLPNRAKTDDASFLPPLDPPSSSRSSMSTMGTGKGVVGWKAPPKVVKESVVKQPTASQTESAKRLSQGLSVAHNRAQRANINAQVTIGDVGTYSVVLDPQEIGGQVVGQDISGWPSTKAQRLYEESRNNRIRIEANRTSNGAVLRQQVFYFDANIVGGGGNENNGSNAPDFTIGIGAGPSVYAGNNSNMSLQGNALQGNNLQYNSQSMKGIHIKPNQPSIAKVTAMGVLPGANSLSANGSVASIGGNAYQSNANPANNPQRNPSMGGASGAKQEELLRQLFPSWF